MFRNQKYKQTQMKRRSLLKLLQNNNKSLWVGCHETPTNNGSKNIWKGYTVQTRERERPSWSYVMWAIQLSKVVNTKREINWHKRKKEVLLRECFVVMRELGVKLEMEVTKCHMFVLSMDTDTTSGRNVSARGLAQTSSKASLLTS